MKKDAEALGIKEKNSEKIACDLNKLLANLFVLYVKTLGFHWNIVSPSFAMFHELFQEHYEALQEDIDEIAERVRKIGQTPLSTMKEYLQEATLKESGKKSKDLKMVEELLDDYHALIRSLRASISKAEELLDIGTADLLTQMIRSFEKRAWVLRSHIA